jgi:hypothetical protein
MQIAALALLSARRGLAATRITPVHSGETMSPMVSCSASMCPGFRPGARRQTYRAERRGLVSRARAAMCFKGLKLTRPALHAVSSPNRRATKPCAAS